MVYPGWCIGRVVQGRVVLGRDTTRDGIKDGIKDGISRNLDGIWTESGQNQDEDLRGIWQKRR